ncbi:MAG TPA: serine/threonine-protein kinase, partial [Streptosporangiaceae bacterium]|nr:serine/threonine-protein kinase [Streptosporangiaceae bacterium]
MTIRTLGSRYLLEEQIGQGGMGVVWRGRDKNAGTQYAIKVLRPEYSADPEAVTRFVRERTVLMRFRHPAVVTVRDMIVEGDQLALVMDLVRGGDLTRYARRNGGTLPPAEVAALSAQICEGLDAAHASGIVHRDLKPANVLLDDGQVRLADFGVARIVGDSSFTSSGIVLGTAAYLAPEMLTGSEPTPACDMYALGITMYEMLAGRPPFTGHVAAVMHDHLDTPPARLPDVPDRLWDLVSSCLAKQPHARPTAAALAVALRDRSLVRALAAVPAAPVPLAAPVPAATPVPVSGPVTSLPLSGPDTPVPLSSPVTPVGLLRPADTTALVPPGAPPSGSLVSGPLPAGPAVPGPGGSGSAMPGPGRAGVPWRRGPLKAPPRV